MKTSIPTVNATVSIGEGEKMVEVKLFGVRHEAVENTLGHLLERVQPGSKITCRASVAR